MKLNWNILIGACRVFKIPVSRCASGLWFSSILLLNIRSVDSCNPIFCLVVLCVLFSNVGSLFSPFLSRFVLCCFVYGRNGIWAVVNKTTSRKDSYCIAMTDLTLRGSLNRSIWKVVIKPKEMHKIKVVMLWCYAHYQTKVFSKRYTGKT